MQWGKGFAGKFVLEIQSRLPRRLTCIHNVKISWATNATFSHTDVEWLVNEHRLTEPLIYIGWPKALMFMTERPIILRVSAFYNYHNFWINAKVYCVWTKRGCITIIGD